METASETLETYMKSKYKQELLTLTIDMHLAACDGNREVTYSLLNDKNSFSKYLAKTLPNFDYSLRNDFLKRIGAYPEFLSYVESKGYQIEIHMVNQTPSCTISW